MALCIPGMTATRWALAGVLALALSGAVVTAAAPVADAAEKSDRTAVRRWIRQRADVNGAQPDGMTALHWAALHDDVETAKLLVGARVTVTNRFGITPLSLACQRGSEAMVAHLLERGADPNTSVRGGETVLMTAARTGKLGPVRALIARGAGLNARERRGQTALMWAAAEGNAEVVRCLIKSGAELNATLPESGFNALFFAVRAGRAEVVRALLKAGVDVNAVMMGRKSGGKGPAKGTSALILAVENGHFELALELVRAGADPNDQRSGHAPLHVMSWVRKPNRGEDDGTPPPAGSGGLSSLQFVRKLAELGADVNLALKSGREGAGQYTKQGATPFLMASATADAPYMRLLVELGADPKRTNVDGCTPLIVACGVGIGGAAANEVAGEEPEILEAAELLLKWGVDINAVDANGETAMHGAAYRNMTGVVKFLADHGAKVEIWNRKNKYGWTPLAIAEGYRPGNFKPSLETVEAIREVMRAAGVTPPLTSDPGAKPAY